MSFKINHRPIFDVEKIIEHYQEKDGVEISYVCTSDLRASDVPVDIFYRSTPHPEFGNRYFGLYYDSVRDHMMITNADVVEDLEFAMINVNDTYHYSQSHHDYVEVGNVAIDGGRAYTRTSGVAVVFIFKVVDGLLEMQKYPGEDGGVDQIV